MTTIYHNPNCGTSRNVLALIRNSGEEPEVVESLETPRAAMSISVRDLLRRKGTPYDELELDDPKFTDDKLIDLMLVQPILINRPIVETPLGTRLCRPSEGMLEILPGPQRGVPQGRRRACGGHRRAPREQERRTTNDDAYAPTV